MSDDRESVRWWTRWSGVIGWDGCLPLVAACSRSALPAFVGRDLAELGALVVVTPAVAIARAHYGSKQLEQLCGSRAYFRQLLFASAIVVLMLFEGLSVMLLSVPVPAECWIVAATMYVVYLGLVTSALRHP
jgi:hypothetical protein